MSAPAVQQELQEPEQLQIGETEVLEAGAEIADAPENPIQESVAPAVDYAKMAEEDLSTIREKIPAMKHLTSLVELPQFERFAALREAGLTAEEAFWAACHSILHTTPYDNRSHLRSAAPRGASGSPHAMTAEEMAAARDLFSDLSDTEIRTLYAKCRT
jgi:hypothetical protein